MAFLRHIGKVGDRKVAIIFREVPGEPHMCLVTYTEVLNAHIHDPMMKCIESDIGQNSENLADALNRTHTQDGRIILQVLHSEGQLKKIQTSQVVMTPTPTARIKLDELNKILNEMKQGEDAVKKLADMDKSMGLQSPAEVARRMRGDKPQAQMNNLADALGDAQLAKQRIDQAQRMEREAKGLLAEAQRLMEEAKQLDPSLNKTEKSVKTETKTKKTKAKVSV